MTIAPWAPTGAVTATFESDKAVVAHGVSLVVTRISHKQMVSGPVVGIWEWELRKGSARVEGRYTGGALLAETAGFGVLAFLDGPRVTLVPWKQQPFTEAEAMAFAEAERVRRNLVGKDSGSGYYVEGSVLRASWPLDGKTLRMAIGMHSRRVLDIRIEASKKSP